MPAVMVLQPISTMLPNFFNHLLPEQQEQEQEEWWNSLCKMQELFKEATSFLFKVLLIIRSIDLIACISD